MCGWEKENQRMIEDDFVDCPDDFKNCIIKTKLKRHRLKPFSSYVFWSGDDDDDDVEFQSPCGVPNLIPVALVSNGRIKEKIRSVIEKIILPSNGSAGCVLIQFWAPRTVGDRYALTTADQPFGLSVIDNGLCEFRMISTKYKFYVDAKSADDPALLGHVFRQTTIVFTPDVKYYSSKEYPQQCDAVNSHIRTSMALPVIEPSSRCCVGVLELLATGSIFSSGSLAEKLLYEIQDVGLKYSDAYGHDFIPVDQVLEEISNGVKVICETHKLPLVQTWVPCRCCIDVELGGSCSRCYTGCKGQVMTNLCVMKGSYALDEGTSGFPFTMNFLLKGQGVAGRALSSYSSSFCRDVTQFSFAEYPLVHVARIFGLTSCFAVCLRSTYTGDADYVIEFFLPLNVKNDCDPRPLLDSILATMKQHFQSFKVASGEELGQELSIEVIKFSEDNRGDSFQICQTATSTPRLPLVNVGGMVQLDSSNQPLVVEASTMNNGRNVIRKEHSNGDVIYSKKRGSGRTSERKNKKTEIPISYEDLEPHFGRNLNDVAKSFSVSRSTLKRICRNHGIKRWSCHKRIKRKASPPELKQVNESVQSAKGAANLTVAFPVLGALVSAETEEPLGETILIDSKGTSQDLRNLCSTAADADCHHGLGFELPATAMNMAPALVLDAEVSTRSPKASIGVLACTQSSAKIGFRNPCPSAVKGSQEDSEQEFPQANASLPVNSLSVFTKNAATPDTKMCPELLLKDLAQELEISVTSSCSRNLSLAGKKDKLHETLLSFERVMQASLANSLSDGHNSTQNVATSKERENPPLSALAGYKAVRGSQEGMEQISQPANSLSDHFTSQPEPPLGGMPMQNVISSELIDKCCILAITEEDACPKEEIACKERDTAMQGGSTVTVKAKYGNDITIKFRLSVSSGLVELQEQVAKRLKLEGETYYIKYKDEEEELILIACNDDLKEYIDTSTSLGKTSLVLLLEPKQPISS